MTITVNLIGSIQDSTGNNLNGKLKFTLTQEIVDDSTVPDRILTREPREFIITNGTVNISVPSTQGVTVNGSILQQDVSYYIEFFKAIPGSSPVEYEENPLFAWYAVVPETTPYQFAQLAPTKLAYDNLANDVYRIAKVISLQPELFSLFVTALSSYRYAASEIIDAEVIFDLNGNAFSRPVPSLDPFRSAGRNTVRTVMLSSNDFLNAQNNGELNGNNGVEYDLEFEALYNLVGGSPTPYTNLFVQAVHNRFSVTGVNTLSNHWVITPGHQLLNGSYVWQNPFTTYDIPSPRVATWTNPELSTSTLDKFVVQIQKVGNPGLLELRTEVSYCYTRTSL